MESCLSSQKAVKCTIPASLKIINNVNVYPSEGICRAAGKCNYSNRLKNVNF